MDILNNYLLEFFYSLIGFILFLTSIYTLSSKNHSTRIGSFLFWLDLAILFAVGPYLPSWWNGCLVVLLGVIAGVKQIKPIAFKALDETKAKISSNKIGNKIFIPCISLAIISILITQLTPLSGQVGIGVGALVSLFIAITITKAKPKVVIEETNRMIQQVGSISILPQLLASLGVVFVQAGVGEVITNQILFIVPEGNRLLGVIAYILGMVTFTMIMGNGFAAFAIITAGIGVPFVISQGANPAIATALALTAGSCGTLMTPMAANFNLLPTAILNMRDRNGVIKIQVPMAILMILLHIILMYYWAF